MAPAGDSAETNPRLVVFDPRGAIVIRKRRIVNGKWYEVWHPKVILVRCADDFIITGDSQELLEKEVRPVVEQFLKDRGLPLSPDKTRITHISEEFA
jgi:RNA-directed DNA polymerase